MMLAYLLFCTPFIAKITVFEKLRKYVKAFLKLY